MAADDIDRPAAEWLVAAGADRHDGQPRDPLSAAPRNQFWLRGDPYYEDWRWHSPPGFTPARTPRYTIDPDTGAAGVRWEDAFDDPEHSELWASALRRPSVRRVISAVDGLRHVDTRQLAWLAIPWSVTNSRYVTPAYEAELLQRGYYTMYDHDPAGSTCSILSLNADLTKRWLRELDPAVAARTLGEGGRRDPHPAGSPLHARHNLITNEVVLRTLEVCPDIVGFTPDHSTSPRTLLGDPDLPSPPADGVLHRHDGLRIALEVSCSRSLRQLRDKAARWATALVGRTHAAGGLCVVFVNANRHEHDKLAADLRRILAEVTAGGELRHPSGAPAEAREVARVRRQMFIASYEDWYPQPSAVSIAGATLTVITTPDGLVWQPLRIAHTQVYEYTPGEHQRHPIPDDTVWAAHPTWADDPPLNVPAGSDAGGHQPPST